MLIQPVDRKEFVERVFPHRYDVMVYTEDNHYYARDSRGNLICADSPTACLQESINYIINKQTRGMVFIRSGVYTISAETLINDSGSPRSYSIAIIGEYGATIQTTIPTITPGYNSGIIHFYSQGGTKEINIEGLNLSLEDSSKSFSNVISIELDGNATAPQTWRIRIRNNKITSSYQINSSNNYIHGILIHSRVVGSGYSPVPVDFDVVIEDNKVVGTANGITVANYGIQGPASGRVIIRNNFVDTKWNMFTPTSGIHVFANSQDPQYFIPTVIIEGNVSLNPGDTAIELSNAINAIIKGNTSNGTIIISYNWINGIVEGNTIYGRPGFITGLGAYASGQNIKLIRSTLIRGNSVYNSTISAYLDLSQLTSPIDMGPISILNNNIVFENTTLSQYLHIIKIQSSNWSNYPPILIMGNNVRVNNVDASGKSITGIVYAAPRARVVVANNNLNFTNVLNASKILGIDVNNGYPGFIYGNTVVGSSVWLKSYYWGPVYVYDNYTDNTNIDVDPGIKIIFKRNDTYRTENSGTITIPTNSTSVTVRHGLVCTPKKVLITPLEQPSGSIWVSNITSTSFDINVSTAPTTDLPVAWYAEC